MIDRVNNNRAKEKRTPPGVRSGTAGGSSNGARERMDLKRGRKRTAVTSSLSYHTCQETSNSQFEFVSALRRKYRTVDEMDMHGATPPRPPKLVPGDLPRVRRTRRRVDAPLLIAQAAVALYEDFPGGPPDRSCKMRKRPDGPKYVDEKFWRSWNPHAPRDERIAFRNRQIRRAVDRIVKGLLGVETYAMTIQQSGTARAGIIDYDEGGIDEARLLIRLAEERGDAAVFAIVIDDRWHAVFLFDDRYAVDAVRNFLDGYRFTHLKHDVFPSGNAVRLPFQKHQIKNRRGILLLPGGREIDLDTEAGLSTGLREYLTLRARPIPIDDATPQPVSLDRENRTPAPEKRAARTPRRPAPEKKPAPAPPASPADAAVGKRIWQSARMRKLAAASPIFGAVYRGETATIDGDDTRSIQVAVIVRSMTMANFPENEIRSVMAYCYPMLRPGYARWREDVERMIAKYVARFAERYNPSPTCFSTGAPDPKEQRSTSYERYVDAFLADPGAGDDEMAQRLGISRSMAGVNRRRLLRERPDLVAVRKAALKQKTGFAALEKALNADPDADIAALAQETGLAESTVRVYRRAIRRSARSARRTPSPPRKKKTNRASINTARAGGAYAFAETTHDPTRRMRAGSPHVRAGRAPDAAIRGERSFEMRGDAASATSPDGGGEGVILRRRTTRRHPSRSPE